MKKYGLNPRLFKAWIRSKDYDLVVSRLRPVYDERVFDISSMMEIIAPLCEAYIWQGRSDEVDRIVETLKREYHGSEADTAINDVKAHIRGVKQKKVFGI